MKWEIRRAGPDDWLDFRDIRLRALQDAPSAFGSTYDRELALTEDDWRQRLTHIAFLAYPDDDGTGRPAGIVGGFETRPATIALVAMWIDPAHRGGGLAEQLVKVLLEDASQQGAAQVELRVTDANVTARRLYERCGFSYTGKRVPLESDPTVDTLIMSYPLRP